MKVSVIGIGNMGYAHAKCILSGEIKGMELIAVCDIDSEKISKFSILFKTVQTYTDYKELIKSGAVESVIIATPHPCHAEIASEALRSGLNVLLEKPADISVTKVKKLNDIAQKSGKIFAIMFNQRTNQLFAKAREIVKSGMLGEIKRTSWIVTNWYRTQSYYDSGDWRATWSGEGGGVLINQAPHNLDLWQWICGMPESVTAFCSVGRYHDIEVEDDVTIVARYINGATGTFITSTGEYPGTNRLEICGDLGKLVLENGLLKWWKLKTNERQVCKTSSEGFAEIDYEYSEIMQETPESSHKGILQNFANAILFGEELISPGTDGIYELLISNAAYLSQWEGNKEIKLPFDYEKFDAYLKKMTETSRKAQNTKEEYADGRYKKRWQVNW